MKRLIWLLPVLAGCAHHSIQLGWVDDAALAYDPAEYPDDAAVVLHRSDHQLMVIADDNYSQSGRHEVVALQTEAAFALAEVKIAFWAKNRLVTMKARMKRPNSAWEELDPKAQLSDLTGTGARDVNAKFFRFPRIEVGTLLEYYWVIESDGLSWGDDQQTVGQYPVRRYLFELEASKQMVNTVTTYNTALPIKSEVLPNKNNRLTLEIHDIPRRPVEDYAPDWTFSEPRWAWRTLAFDWGSQSSKAHHTWDELLNYRGGVLFGLEGELFEEFVAPTLPACGDLTCKVAAARAWVAKNARNMPDGDGLTCRKMTEVLEAKRANTQERAVLLRRLLSDAGLDARLAFATRHWSAQVDPQFPTLARFNDMLVFLPAQPGLEKDTWLDPTCDSCAAGALPSELRGLEVLLFNATRLGIKGVEVKSEWRSTVDAASAQTNLVRIAHRAQLDAAGTLTDTMARTAQGPSAQWEEMSVGNQTHQDFLKEARKEAGRSSALARVVEVSPQTCVVAAGTCESGRKVELPAYSTAESETRLLVPLNALTDAYGNRLTKSKAQRVSDVYLRHEEAFEEVFELDVQPGFALENVPQTVKVKTGLVETSVKVEATAKGARVTRTLKRDIGGVTLAEYDEVQSAFRAFQDARHLVLSFVKK